METKRETPSGPFLAQGGANLCSVLRGKVALDTQRLAPGLWKRCGGKDYRLKSARFSNEREHKEQWANPMLSTSLILRGQPSAGVSIRVDYDLSRSEDNRPRANPRPARDKLKRASVEPVSRNREGLICRRTENSVDDHYLVLLVLLVLLLLLLLVLFLILLILLIVLLGGRVTCKANCQDGTKSEMS